MTDDNGHRRDALARLDASLAASGCNLNDRVITLIEAYLEDGPAPGSHIAATLIGIGHNRGHVWSILTRGTGPTPARHRWWLDADGNLHLHCAKRSAA